MNKTLGLIHSANINMSVFCVPGTMLDIGLVLIPRPLPIISNQEPYKDIVCYDHCFEEV